MWEPLSMADERYYKRKAAQDAARRERMKALKEDQPRRLDILAKVRAGELTLAAGQRLIRSKAHKAKWLYAQTRK